MTVVCSIQSLKMPIFPFRKVSLGLSLSWPSGQWIDWLGLADVYILSQTRLSLVQIMGKLTLIARFMGPTWGPTGADGTQVGPIFAPWTLLSGETFAREHQLNLHLQIPIPIRPNPYSLCHVSDNGSRVIKWNFWIFVPLHTHCAWSVV